jgi:hypothetical protein
MATLYYNAAVDTDWSELGNWWTDSGFSVQATALPTSGDDAILNQTCDTNSGSEPTVVNLTFNGSGYLGISITVTGMATFNDSSSNYFFATVAGDATFNDNSYNFGPVTGNATFNNNSYNLFATVAGDATFNDSSYNFGIVTGNATFNNSSFNSYTVTGNATFNDNAENRLGFLWPYGTVGGNAVFNGNSVNTGNVLGNADFNNDSVFWSSETRVSEIYNPDTFQNETVVSFAKIAGTATFRHRAVNKSGLDLNSGVLVLAYDKGINGSSILGVL